MRVTVDGKATIVDAGHMDRRIARSEDGRTVWFAVKFSDDAADKRFTIYRADDRRPEAEGRRGGSGGEAPGNSARVPVAMIVTTCRTERLRLTLSPEGKYLHVSALGTLEEGGEAVSFDLVIATDGSHRRLLPVKGWAAGDAAIVHARQKSLDVVNVQSGARRSLVLDSVDQFTVSRDGECVAYMANGALQRVGAPA